MKMAPLAKEFLHIKHQSMMATNPKKYEQQLESYGNEKQQICGEVN